MKEIVIISGKGGTGKTVITAGFAALAKSKVMADCDVDAADLHLLLAPRVKEKDDFRSGLTAFIDKDKCNQCGLCRKLCRFSAVNSDFTIDSLSCEGCAFCSFVCPQQAIGMRENLAGEWFISDTRFGPMVHAKLGIAQENSGKLVSLVRRKAKETAEAINAEWVIIDGSPGIGCPVIASVSGVDCAVVVTEPTLSGLHDADRVIKMARHFGILTKLVVNKYDLNIDMTKRIERYCKDSNIDLIGKIPFAESIVEAMVKGKTIIEYIDKKTASLVSDVWEKIKA